MDENSLVVVRMKQVRKIKVASYQPSCISLIRQVIEAIGYCHRDTTRYLPALQQRRQPLASALDTSLEDTVRPKSRAQSTSSEKFAGPVILDLNLELG